ncbi:hypothetical protein IH979_00040 [Patescibacteria group bacterium]|nr:hypothetical protein [Patescibacteria group bacterium]
MGIEPSTKFAESMFGKVDQGRCLDDQFGIFKFEAVLVHKSLAFNGAEIARRETVFEGSIPLHNLRADVDFARVPSHTIYGTIGVKVWIYRGEIFEGEEEEKGPRVARKERPSATK